jgi:hypothetical protein
MRPELVYKSLYSNAALGYGKIHEFGDASQQDGFLAVNGWFAGMTKQKKLQMSFEELVSNRRNGSEASEFGHHAIFENFGRKLV